MAILIINNQEITVEDRSSAESIYVVLHDQDELLPLWREFNDNSIMNYELRTGQGEPIAGSGAELTGFVLFYNPDSSMTVRFDIRQKSEAEELQETLGLIGESVKLTVPSWDPDGHEYSAGTMFSRDGMVYVVIQGHRSQADWTPESTPALYRQIYAIKSEDGGEAIVDEYPDWIQPAGAHDAYSEGDKVTHNDKHWVSGTDNNVWEPGVYGWNETE
ncbi:MAG: hypothetical protein IJ860_09255 [Eubacterium sp.]|nr:hypothetical protein [Eubacterium sp.]